MQELMVTPDVLCLCHQLLWVINLLLLCVNRLLTD
jgi:hypothetical protein